MSIVSSSPLALDEADPGGLLSITSAVLVSPLHGHSPFQSWDLSKLLTYISLCLLDSSTRHLSGFPGPASTVSHLMNLCSLQPSFDPSQHHFPFLTSYTITRVPRLATLPLLTFPSFCLLPPHNETYVPPFASKVSQLAPCFSLNILFHPTYGHIDCSEMPF